MKRLNDEELERLYNRNIGDDLGHIQIELSLRLLDKLNEKPEERRIVLA